MRSDLFTTGSLIGPFIGINSVNTDVTLRIPDSSTITASWCSCHQPPGKPGKMAESGHGMKWNTSGNILIGSPWIRFESFGTEQRGSLLEGNLFHVRAGYRTDLWIHIIDFTIMLGSQSFTSLTIVLSFLLLKFNMPRKYWHATTIILNTLGDWSPFITRPSAMFNWRDMPPSDPFCVSLWLMYEFLGYLDKHLRICHIFVGVLAQNSPVVVIRMDRSLFEVEKRNFLCKYLKRFTWLPLCEGFICAHLWCLL